MSAGEAGIDRYEWLRSVGRGCGCASLAKKRDYVFAAARDRLDLTGDELVAASHGMLRGRNELDTYSAGYLGGLVQASSNASPEGTKLEGYDPRIVKTRFRLDEFARTRLPVLLVGERGTGKGRLMRAIAARMDADPLTVSLSGLPASLAESELFGHEKGSFTGAEGMRHGIIESAIRGRRPVFFDDVAECPRGVQAKLLTVLDDGVFRRVGADELVSVGRGESRQFRLFSSSQPQALSRLRADLRDRLATLLIWIPPLRTRCLDVLLLADLMVREMRPTVTNGARSMSRGAQERLLSYPWPGNVRQLGNVLARVVFESAGRLVVRAAAIDNALEDESRMGESIGAQEDDQHLGSDAQAFPTMAEVRARHFGEALHRAGGNLTHAARLLDVHRTTVQTWLRSQSKTR